LINPFLWGYGLYAGNDGGAWIPALAGNPTIPPPVLYGFGSESQKILINQLCQDVTQYGNVPEELWKYMTANGINYLYTGARGGPIFPSALLQNPHFRPLFYYENTWVFELVP
jgi:hypothetical protein